MTLKAGETAGTCELQSVPCDHCGCKDTDVLFSTPDWTGIVTGRFSVAVCRTCGLARTDPQPTPETLALAYGKDYGPHDATVKTTEAPRGLLRWCLANYRGYPLGRPAPALLRALLKPLAAMKFRNRYWVGYVPYDGDGRLLDLGCGIGRYVARMAVAGWKAEGLEPAPRAVQTGRTAGLTIREGTLPGTTLPEASYDVVTMWHVLEHVPSPKATLEAVRRLLRPGGRVMVIGPRLDSLGARWFGPYWYGVELPRHLTHFTKATLRRHIEAAGLEVERMTSLRRPTFVRRSMALMAKDKDSAVCRLLARGRLIPRLLSHVASVVGRTDEMVCMARRS